MHSLIMSNEYACLNLRSNANSDVACKIKMTLKRLYGGENSMIKGVIYGF